MSGGSFDYLFRRDVMELAADSDLLELVEHMADELKRFGNEGALARDLTLQLHADVAELRTKIQGLDQKLDRLRSVWQSVEYRCSNDSSDDAVRKDLADFNLTSQAKA